MAWKPGQSPVAHGTQVPPPTPRSPSSAVQATPGITAPATLIKARDIAVGGISLSTQVGNTVSLWLPVLQFGGAAVGITYTQQNGFVFQFGKLVFANFQLVLSSKGTSTGNAAIVGLPFVAIPTPSNPIQCVYPLAYGSMVASPSMFAAAILGNVNFISLQLIDNTTGNMQSMTDANFNNTSAIGGAIIYISK